MRTATQTKQPALPAQTTQPAQQQHNCPGCIRDGLAKRRKRASTRYCAPHMGQLYLDCEETGIRLHHPSHYVVPLIALGTDTLAPDSKPFWYALHDAAKIVARLTGAPIQTWRQGWIDAHDQPNTEMSHDVLFCVTPDAAIPALERALALAGYSPVYKPFPDPADPAEIGPIDEDGLDELGIDADLTRESVAGFRALLARITTPIPAGLGGVAHAEAQEGGAA